MILIMLITPILSSSVMIIIIMMVICWLSAETIFEPDHSWTCWCTDWSWQISR
jgi:hypothetical protein